MLTRTPDQIALAEASRLCQEFADLCRDAGEQTDDVDLQQLMTRLIEQHERVRVAFDERLRALDDLPLSPDPELEAVKKVVTRLKKMFGQESLVLLEERIEHEEKLLSHFADALETDLTPPTRQCLEEGRRTAEEGMRLLSQEQSGRAR